MPGQKIGIIAATAIVAGNMMGSGIAQLPFGMINHIAGLNILFVQLILKRLYTQKR